MLDFLGWGKLRKFILLFIVAIFIASVPVYSQTESETSLTVEDAQDTKSLEGTISLDIDETNSGYVAGAGFSFWDVLRVILVLALIVGCIYFVLWLIKRGMKISPSDDPFLRKVSSLDLAPGKSVQIVSLVDKAYMLGVCDNTISLISEITDKDLVDSMNVYADKKKNSAKPRNFEELLSIFTKGSSSQSSSDVSKKESGEKLVDLLKKQRERINGDRK